MLTSSITLCVAQVGVLGDHNRQDAPPALPPPDSPLSSTPLVHFQISCSSMPFLKSISLKGDAGELARASSPPPHLLDLRRPCQASYGHRLLMATPLLHPHHLKSLSSPCGRSVSPLSKTCSQGIRYEPSGFPSGSSLIGLVEEVGAGDPLSSLLQC